MDEYRIDASSRSGGGGSEPSELEQRLDALARAVVTAETTRAEPPEAYLNAANQRAMFAGTRRWTARLAAAAAAVAIGVTGLFLWRASSPDVVPSNPIAAAPPTTASPDPQPTLAELNTMNRATPSPDSLRLADTTPSAASATNQPPMRASDTRRPERIDAILNER